MLWIDGVWNTITETCEALKKIIAALIAILLVVGVIGFFAWVVIGGCFQSCRGNHTTPENNNKTEQIETK